jgi:hypothetical protein
VKTRPRKPIVGPGFLARTAATIAAGAAPVAVAIHDAHQPTPPSVQDVYTNQKAGDLDGSNGNCNAVSVLVACRLIGLADPIPFRKDAWIDYRQAGVENRRAMTIRALGGSVLMDHSGQSELEALRALYTLGAKAEFAYTNLPREEAIGAMQRALTDEPSEVVFIITGMTNAWTDGPLLGCHSVVVAAYDWRDDRFIIHDSGGSSLHPIRARRDQLEAFFRDRPCPEFEIIEVRKPTYDERVAPPKNMAPRPVTPPYSAPG